MISLLIYILNSLLIFGVILYVVRLIPLPPPFALSLPGHDGLELVSEITQRLKAKPVPVVVLTGGGPAAARQAIDRGARHAILKGARPEDILIAIEAAMGGA